MRGGSAPLVLLHQGARRVPAWCVVHPYLPLLHLHHGQFEASLALEGTAPPISMTHCTTDGQPMAWCRLAYLDGCTALPELLLWCALYPLLLVSTPHFCTEFVPEESYSFYSLNGVPGHLVLAPGAYILRSLHQSSPLVDNPVLSDM